MLTALLEAGVLSPVDVHLARAAARLAGEANPDAVLAMALASKAPTAGHVCLDLAAARRAVRLEEAPDLDTLPWPEPAAWVETLRHSPLVGDGAAPLVLDGHRLYLQRSWRWQQALVAALRARVGDGAPEGEAWRTRAGAVDLDLLRRGLDRLFPRDDGELDRQRLAAAVAVLRSFAVITGGPGTGKTTTVVKVLALLAEQAGGPLRIALAAPTGKAAARLAEAVRAGRGALGASPTLLARIPDEATTIHRLLGWRPDGSVRHTAEDPIPADVVVVDEASMVDLGLMTRLVLAVPRRARIVLLGDRDQLASVESGAVLADLCGPPTRGFSTRFAATLTPLVGPFPPELVAGPPTMGDAVVALVRTHRFQEGSGIGALARAVNVGDAARAAGLLDGSITERPGVPHDDLRWVRPTGGVLPPEVEQTVVAELRPLVSARDPGEALAALDRFRLLCAHRRGLWGVEGLNEAAERWLEGAGLIAPRGLFWRGRPVLVSRNDPQSGLFNGDLGVVLPGHGGLAVWFPGADGQPRPVSPALLPAHETAFAMTVHKSQGSEVSHAMVVLPERPSPVLTRELLYTGLTRARHRVTVVGAPGVLAVTVAERVERASGLGDALWGW